YLVDGDSGALTASGEALVLSADPSDIEPDPSGSFVYVTSQGEAGIRVFALDQTSGELDEVDDSPFAVTRVQGGTLAFLRSGAYVFASGGGLSAFAVNRQSGA